MKSSRFGGLRLVVAIACALLCALAVVPARAFAEESGPTPIYQTLDELEGKRFAYVNGSVYNLKIQERLEGTHEDFYPSLAECVAAVEAGKEDAAVQLSSGCQLVVNRRPGTVALLPEPVCDVSEGFFFPKGSELKAKFNSIIKKFSDDGTLAALEEKWLAADESQKTLPEQDWDAPNGTLKFVTSGVLEPLSYVGQGGEPKGYDVELALLIAKELGYHLKVTTAPMDSIFAEVNSGKSDFGGTLTETPERASVCEFSDTVMPMTISVIVKAEGGSGGATKTLEFNSFDELDGKRIGVLNGSVTDQVIQGVLNGTNQFLYYNNVADMIAALQSKKVDAIGMDEPASQLAENREDGIATMPEPLTTDEYGFFFAKGSPLTAEFSRVIKDMEANGALDRLKEKWTSADESGKTLPEQDWETPNGTLTFATSGLVEPLSYLKDGKITGYDIDVAMLACKELGYGINVEVQDFAATLASVPAGKADFGGGGVSITEERAQTVDFTSPEYHSSVVLMVRATTTEPDAVGTFVSGLTESFKKTFIEEDRWQLIVSGLGVTVLISVCAGALGVLLGFATVLARRNGAKWATKLVNGYQALMGGVPLVVVLMVLYYVVFGSLNVPGVLVAILAFTLSFGSTAGATMWTAVDGIDIIQEETGLALGYTRKEVFRKIIFPQARQQFLPQLMGQFVSLVKETSIVGYISVQDLTRASDLIRSRTMDAFFPLISTAIIYFLFCRLLAWALNKTCARFDVTNHPREIEGVEQ